MKRVVVFLGTLVFFAALAWLGGYNFDTRGFLVAWSSLVAIVFSFIIAFMSEL